jgi:DNA-binding transcriptional ArsR family regulator
VSEAEDLLFKALADPGRRKLLDRLHVHDGQTLGELCEHLQMSRQGVTQHLALLEAANLIAIQWRGREKLHFLNPVPLQEIYDRWIAKFERPRLKALSELKHRLERADKPPRPRRRPS